MGVPNTDWKVEDGNSNFDMCDTYPPLIYVPTSTTKAMLLGSSKFRSRGRLPVLTYLHSNGVMKVFIYLKINYSLNFSGFNNSLFSTIIWF